MGADGSIKIWKRSEVEKVFPDCTELFENLPFHYLDKLDGVMYDHCYTGTNAWHYWQNIEDCTDSKTLPAKVERLKEFITWLEKNGTVWEVWT